MPTKEQTAAAELERAEKGAAEVLERIKTGDRKVGPDDLEAAERDVRFARARLEGEERRRREEAGRGRLRHLEEIRERALSELDPEPVRVLREAAEKALDAYIAACVEHNTKLDGIASDLSGLEPLPEGLGVRHGSDGASLTVGGRDIRRVRPMVEVSEMARTALREHIPYGFIDLERPY